MEANTVILWMIVAGVCFIAFLLYTRQIKWVFNIIRNGAVGCACILAVNYALSATGLAVGINLMTAFIVGVLGIPGFFLLYVAQIMIM